MPAQKQRILVIKLGALGDFIQALGPMAAIRRHHPDAEITLLTTAPFVSFAEKSGYFDRIWIDQKPKWKNLRGWIELRKKLNEPGFQRVYDLQNNDRTSFYFRLFKASRRPEWVGAARGASHRNASPERTAGLAFDGHVQTLALAGIRDVAIDNLSWIKGDAESFNIGKPYILLVPGSAPDRPEKRWPAERYGELARAIESRGQVPVILGSKNEAELAKKILSICPGAVDLTGKTSLEDIAVLARNAIAAIGNDTGPMHIIAPTGCPCCVLFSRHSNPERHAPKGPRVISLREDDLSLLTIDRVMDSGLF